MHPKDACNPTTRVCKSLRSHFVLFFIIIFIRSLLQCPGQAGAKTNAHSPLCTSTVKIKQELLSPIPLQPTINILVRADSYIKDTKAKIGPYYSLGYNVKKQK